MQKGLLITFEGGEGCGKSTQSNAFCEYLTTMGYSVLHLREPGGTGISEDIRKLVKDPKYSDKCDETELLLFEASRAELCRKCIRPALDNGQIVVVDRFTDSTLAYQGYGRGMDLEVINTLNHFATAGLTPDLTFYLRMSPQSAFRRKGGRDDDAMELLPMQFHDRVLEGFDTIARDNPERVVTIDSSLAISSVTSTITNTFEERYGQLIKI
ncbi:MAG: dTMP kinase [Clostridia bacterium]|nr:dTMP kinase [Clostridia bacterium]